MIVQKDQILLQKDQKVGELQKTVFVDSLNKLYPKDYPAKVENWPDTLPMKKHVVNNDVYVMEYNSKIYKEELEKKEQEDIKREFIDILPKLYPQWYPVNFKDWPSDSWGKKMVNNGNFKVMEDHLPEYRKWLADKMELIEILPKIMPESYPVNYEEWTNQYAKGLLDKGDYKTIGQSLPSYRKQLVEKEQETIKKEFVKSLNELDPYNYTTDPTTWFYKDGRGPLPMKVHYDTNNFYVMGYNTKIYKKQLEEISAKKLEEAKRLKEEEEARKEQLLNDQAQEIARVKELLSIKDLEAQTKDQLLLAKELEKQELARQKEIEKQELLAQQELEKKELLAQKEAELQDKLHDKSLVKNQVIGELHGALSAQEKEAYKLQIEYLMKELEFNKKALEFKEKEVELHKKEAEDARVISELKGQLLTLKALYGHDLSFAEEFSAIQFRAENSIANNDFDDIADLSRYISRLVEAERDNSVSADISALLANISPISPINSVQHPVAAVGNHGNFDIDQMHVIHSVLLSGSSEISILEDGSI